MLSRCGTSGMAKLSTSWVGRERGGVDFVVNDPRVCVVIDAAHSPPDDSGRSAEIPKVFVEGRAEVVEEPNIGGQWVAVAEEMSLRYLGPNGPGYLVPTLNQPRWLIKVVPDKVRTWQGVAWARRYWVEGTGGPQLRTGQHLKGIFFLSTFARCINRRVGHQVLTKVN